MVYDFHTDKARYFDYQYRNSRDYILPFVEKFMDGFVGKTVLEIGCAEGGVLKAFLESGCRCTGIELRESRIEHGRKFLAQELESRNMRFISKDIHKIEFGRDIDHKFDLIILKDVIEHIYGQKELIEKLKDFLNPGGMVFFGFPPWQMPFGGHQQMFRSKLLSVTPYFHMLPGALYKWTMKVFGEDEIKIKGMMSIKDTGISIERFEKIVQRSGFRVIHRRHFLINPIYRFKFGLKPREQYRALTKIPWLRNFYTTAVYYLIGIK